MQNFDGHFKDKMIVAARCLIRFNSEDGNMKTALPHIIVASTQNFT